MTPDEKGFLCVPTGCFYSHETGMYEIPKAYGAHTCLLITEQRTPSVLEGPRRPPSLPRALSSPSPLYSFICLGTEEVGQMNGQKNKRRNGRDCFLASDVFERGRCRVKFHRYLAGAGQVYRNQQDGTVISLVPRAPETTSTQRRLRVLTLHWQDTKTS